MQKLMFLLVVVVILSGCSTTKIVKEYVFPDLPDVYATKDLTKDDIQTVLVKPISQEGFPEKRSSIYFTEILINALTKLNIQGILVENENDLESFFKKYKTTIVCETRLLYQFSPAASEANQKLKSKMYVDGIAGVSNTNADGQFKAKGDYYKFISAFCKIRDIKSEKILFTDEVNLYPVESKAIKRMMEDLSVILASDDIGAYTQIYLRNTDTQKIIRNSDLQKGKQGLRNEE